MTGTLAGDLLQTKLFAPRPRAASVSRPHLVDRLDQALRQGCRLTLVSAPAGSGKTTLVGEWLAAGERPFAWLSLDERESDLTRFLAYLVAALQTLSPEIGKRAAAMLESPQPPPNESVLTMLLNEIAAFPREFTLVLDDFHAVDARPIDRALIFLLEHLPPQMHLVIITREDPNWPLAGLRGRGQLAELRAADLRFSRAEAGVFFAEVMGLHLDEGVVAALEARTEGWIAGLQMAALSVRGQPDTARFIQSFTGSHRFVLDYLVEEVLSRQPKPVQEFLLQTAVLNQLTAPLCGALTGSSQAQEILEGLERANLFLVPLDHERRWYRYHHLFAELLRQRLAQRGDEEIDALHIRASQWYEANGLELEAFQHAAAAHDVERAVRLIEGDGKPGANMPLYFRGEVAPVRQWLESLPEAEFQARPSLWVTYASVLTMTGRLPPQIEGMLQAAENALRDAAPDDRTGDLLGQIAAIRAMLAVPKNQVETIIAQSQRALELLHPDNAPMRTTTTWALGYAYQVQGDRAAACRAYEETIANSQKSGNIMTAVAATTCLGQIQETENQMHQAVASFQRILEMVGDPPWPAACEAYVGLARIHYQWNELDAAEQHGQQGLALARQLENVDTPAACGVLLARVKLARGDAAGALATLDEADLFVRQHHFDHWSGEITAVRIQVLLHQGHHRAAAQLAQTHDLPLSQARVQLAQGDPAAALAALEPVRAEAEARDWADQRLQVLILQALARQAQGETQEARQALDEALAMAAPAGLIRLFVDEGLPMTALLQEAAGQSSAPAFGQELLDALGAVEFDPPQASRPLLDPLSGRERDVLQLLATELNGPEIARQLMVSLNTMRTHTKNIYSKLGVNSRRAAVNRARELGLL